MWRRIVLSLVCFTSITPALMAQNSDVWLRRLNDAQASARQLNKPLMIVFRCER